MNVALKMSTELLFSCWVCSQEGRNHCGKAGVNVPLLEAALFEAGKSRTLVPSRKQGYNYHNTQLASDLPFLTPALLPSLAPAQVRTDWALSVSQTGAQTEEQPTPAPFESFLISFYCAALADINPPAQGAPEPPTEGGPPGQVESEQLRRRIYASSHLCHLSVASAPVFFEGLHRTSQLLAKSAIITSVTEADFSRPLEANNRDSQLHYYIWNVESRS